jgi:hypothetical protein
MDQAVAFEALEPPRRFATGGQRARKARNWGKSFRFGLAHEITAAVFSLPEQVVRQIKVAVRSLNQASNKISGQKPEIFLVGGTGQAKVQNMNSLPAGWLRR